MKKIKIIFYNILFFFYNSTLTYASGKEWSGIEKGEGLSNPLEAYGIHQDSMDLKAMVLLAIKTVIKFSIPVLFLVWVYIGLQFVLAQGDPKKLETAKSWALWAFIGSAVILGSNGIYHMLNDTVNSVGLK